jgi:phage/plasmid-associated DNA primase
VWGSNELPPLDQGEGMWRRIVPVLFQHHPRWKDNDLEKKLNEEAAGILNWAITGLRRLLRDIAQGGDWELPASVKATIDQYKSSSDPILSFSREEIDYSDPNAHVSLIEVYQRFSGYMRERGFHTKPLDPIFYQDLQRIGLTVDPTYSNGSGEFAVYLKGGKIRPAMIGSFGMGG